MVNPAPSDWVPSRPGGLCSSRGHPRLQPTCCNFKGKCSEKKRGIINWVDRYSTEGEGQRELERLTWRDIKRHRETWRGLERHRETWRDIERPGET